MRADHYFNLHNEANGLPFNLVMAPETSVKSGSGNSEAVTDGTPVTLWTAENKQDQWLGFDFGGARVINRCVVRHAGEHGMSADLNTRAFTVRASIDGKIWKTVDAIKGNTLNVTDIEIKPVRARYVKFTVDQAGRDGTARISDVEIYGRM